MTRKRIPPYHPVWSPNGRRPEVVHIDPVIPPENPEPPPDPEGHEKAWKQTEYMLEARLEGTSDFEMMGVYPISEIAYGQADKLEDRGYETRVTEMEKEDGWQ